MSVSVDTINKELKKAGVSVYGRWKHPSKLLHTIIRDDEHIEAAAYGQSAQGSAMLVATNKRVIFVEGNMMYNSSDDFGYGVVSGVNHQSSALFEAVTLYTKLNTYHLTYVNRGSAERFVKVVEDKVVGVGTQSDTNDLSDEKENDVTTNYAPVTDEVRDFLNAHETMVVSTASRTGQINAAVVYYVFMDNVLYMLTKKETQKARDMTATHVAAVTIYDAHKKQTAQIQAEVSVVGDPELSQHIFMTISIVMHGGVENLPIAQLDAGGYVVFRLRPVDIQYNDFGRNIA